ncbi:hypothetical protein ACJMK2_004694 [Sinanodonta woodiana]|uniref:Uncharacterized protein n=1 Tax=Sinanodonta woodiana TaxID=1069815 RepID=A0ABD3VMU9_SINWO
MKKKTPTKVETLTNQSPDFKLPPLSSKADSILPEREFCSLVLGSKVNNDHDRDSLATLAEKIRPIENPILENLDTSSYHTRVGEWIDKYIIDVATKEETEDIYAFIDDPKPSNFMRKGGSEHVRTQSAAEVVNSSPDSTEERQKGGSDLAACPDTTKERQKGRGRFSRMP